ncbi:MAG: hypothetical protein IJS15_16975 [Victivallales bacterium]|nr:hypothetical protein [Victivallales bacterium]
MDYRIDFEARDLLYFGDGLQADGSTAGSGVNWPLPSIVNSALIAAMHNGLEDDVQKIESRHSAEHYNKRELRKGASVRYTFGGVQTVGPFPFKDGKMYVPIPADIQAGKDGGFALMRLIPSQGGGNLPRPLNHLVAPSLPPSKETPGNWISVDDLEKYLDGNCNIKPMKNSEFYGVERRVGIGINPDTLSTEEGKFYSAEYMRLQSGVSLRVYATYNASGYQGRNATDMMAKAMEKDVFSAIRLGGQAGIVFRKEMRKEDIALSPVTPTRFVKWILLTPAIFGYTPKEVADASSIEGWRPGFVDKETGKVHLKTEVPRANLPRDEWRKLVNEAPEIDARLIAARIPKHNVASGWKLGASAGQPKPTRRIVPAGSVFYFECADDDNAKSLITALHARSRSDECGEQGFGFGVCGNFEISK